MVGLSVTQRPKFDVTDRYFKGPSSGSTSQWKININFQHFLLGHINFRRLWISMRC